ncbi:hypothetical protein P691DRAFT_733047 [Macrolepiota fuliginosa MF-IS2]|uniref:Uncharacterized protein n=1 Tax=Macrolepiota fuliginosa MF-IS2 TaxID=1400762 RepID=A0A9P5XBG1_9AGAR|nr:hypothetical protein P691DRAFT_733047 [Macrolepiota fuliginosa MF-IS2]
MKLLKLSFLSARSKSLYTRLTLTRFTILYLSFALASCTILVILQAITLVENHAGVDALEDILAQAGATRAQDGLPMILNGNLVLCDGIPNRPSASCRVLWGWNMGGSSLNNETISLNPRAVDSIRHFSAPVDTRAIGGEFLDLPNNCIYSLRWLLDTLQDNMREDVVTLCFQFWLISLAFITLLNESIPHLAACLFGHVLGTGWAGYRVQSTIRLTYMYRKAIVPGLCLGKDFLGGWWDQRLTHAIGIIVVNTCTLAALMYLSCRLFKVYASQSFARVGAPDKIRRIYRIILLFSASLQLTGFFSLASIGIWLDKINQGIISRFTSHGKLYLALFIVTLVLMIPWLVLGWVCVRRECLRRYGIFCVISLFLVTLFTALFFSPVYRFIFLSWSFFATMTVTSYVCVVIASILGIMCRLNFGKGLAHYFQVNEALAGVNFTAGTFYDDKADPENALPLPVKLSDAKYLDGRGHHLVLTQTRSSSVYSRSGEDPIILSSTPPDVKSLIAVPHKSLAIIPTPQIRGFQDTEIKEDILTPAPARRKSLVSLTNRAGPLLQVSELPERLSSLAGLQQALNEFPLPPAVAPLPMVSRYAISTVSQMSSARYGGEDREIKDIGNGKSGWF